MTKNSPNDLEMTSSDLELTGDSPDKTLHT